MKALDWIVDEGTIPIPDGVRPEEAVFVEPVNTCLKAVLKAGVSKGETALVVGQGPIGLLLMQLLRWSGVSVFVSDLLEERRGLGRSLGATEVLDAGVDVAAEVRGLTDGRGADSASVDVQDQAARLVFGREIRVLELVSHRLPFERALEAFDLAFQPGPGTLKVVVEREPKAR